jgi:hypothetical protein
MIIGRDSLHELGIDLLLNLGVIKWDNATVPMRDPSQPRDTEIDASKISAFMILIQLKLFKSKKAWMSSMLQQTLMKGSLSVII